MKEPVTAIVLAGGKSTRMGADKALLHLPDGETLIEHALALAASVATEVKLVGSRARYSELRWSGELIEDIFPGCGPLGGIHAGLNASATDLNLVLAIDMPAVTRELLVFLLQEAEKKHALVTAARTDNRWQPLCAVYRKPFASVVEHALREGRYKVDATFTDENAHLVSEDELRKAGFSPDLFANCNTAAEWQQFATRASRR